MFETFLKAYIFQHVFTSRCTIFSCCTRPSVKPQAALPAARLLKDQDRFVRARACATLGRCVVTPEMVELLCLGRKLCRGSPNWDLHDSVEIDVENGDANGKLGTINWLYIDDNDAVVKLGDFHRDVFFQHLICILYI